MKHLLWGVALLLLLLLASICVTALLTENTLPVSYALQEAAEAAQAGDWQQAQARTLDAQRYWEQKRGLTAALVNHSSMGRVEELFSQLPAYAREQDEKAYAAVCLQLTQITRAISEENAFSWWNLL